MPVPLVDPASGVITSTSRARILVVDDHPANLVALVAVLEPLGHDIVCCHSGEEALRELLAREFALILLDVQMPGMDGFRRRRWSRVDPSAGRYLSSSSPP